ncbi:ArsR family transcriptional regulator [Oceanobacillus damuensis]|uniref:ArsR family transcriptional regulator n=1 Tax=Oceanobacillus damuensis TaxID=937928 RepID=UPI000834D365|nr:ArsR family transcriptional regulator [Oceanobacillus damuensis]
MKHLVDNFYGMKSHVFELLAFLFRLNNHESLNENNPSGTNNENFDEYIKKSRTSLSQEMKEELDCFFHEDSYFGLTLTQLIIEKNKTDDIQEFIDFLEELPFEQMMSSFLTSGYSIPQSMPDFNDRDEVFKAIQSSILPAREQAKLLYLYFDEKRTKERFINIIKEINEKLYQPSLERLTRIHESSMKKLSIMDGEQIRELLQRNFTKNTGRKFKRVILVPSYCYYHASLFSYNEKTDTVVTLFGTETLEAVDEKSEEDVIELVRALSDRTKLNIIKELNIRPRYGFELAKKLNVSGPTISHHISKLSSLGLITATRKENKIYFEPNHSEIESALRELSSILIQKEKH